MKIVTTVSLARTTMPFGFGGAGAERLSLCSLETSG
jgi:hypothetical protein